METSSNTGLPSWLSVPEPSPPALSQDGKALIFIEYETVYPRILEKLCSGCTLNSALKDIPYEIDPGAYIRWIKKDHTRFELYREAKEIRTEAWAGKIIEHATAEDLAEDVQRSRLIVDTYRWLMGADNRRTYGDIKQVELGVSISITKALAAAQARVIEAEVIDVTPEDRN